MVAASESHEDFVSFGDTEYFVIRMLNTFKILVHTSLILVKGAVHLSCHTGLGYRSVSKSMTHYDSGGGGGMANYDV